MNKNRTCAKKIVLLAIHIFIFISTTIIVTKGVMAGAGKGQVGNKMVGLGYFKAFTMDSNVLAGISSFVLSICMGMNILKKEDKIPYAAVVFQFISAVALGLTFVVACAFLGPRQVSRGNSYFVTFSHDMFFFHFLNPLLVWITLILDEKDYRFGRKENLAGLLPAVVYSLVYEYFVEIVKEWPDFYGFTFGGKRFMMIPVCAVIYSLSYLAGRILIKLKNRQIER